MLLLYSRTCLSSTSVPHRLGRCRARFWSTRTRFWARFLTPASSARDGGCASAATLIRPSSPLQTTAKKHDATSVITRCPGRWEREVRTASRQGGRTAWRRRASFRPASRAARPHERHLARRLCPQSWKARSWLSAVQLPSSKHVAAHFANTLASSLGTDAILHAAS